MRSGGILISVIKIAIHPNYDGLTFYPSDSDVSVLTVPTNAFQGNSNIAPIAIHTSEVPAGTRCYVVGWGQTNTSAYSDSNELRYASMNIVSQSICIGFWVFMPNAHKLSCIRYCYGVDLCKGDEGTALVCDGKLSGIVSRGGCSNMLSLFTNIVVPSIRSFIRDQTGI
ncbi:trypsin-1-like [Anopheles merus]|uniref:trypsin-1-like n=1 Tax=Anopheles merus TaxID=30066 RepID=UPI001BE47477|nr:trypsin-1-like [Anopheles merus]